jgi:phosphatidylserine/phosphatidylglycerophosphate/cardiolipin synthase-like enzyme
LIELGLIRDTTESICEGVQAEDTFSYVADEEHYTEVFRRMTEVKHCLKIATGDLKNFNVTIDSNGGEEKLRLCDFFMLLVERGVRVRVVCMKPFGFYLYAKENCPLLLEHPLFELRYNGHNHMKVFIFDDECAYIGSANLTSAAIGKRANGNRNHEAGMLVWEPTMIKAPLQHFEKVWNDPDILKSTWKRFVTKAKELDKELKVRYGK